MTTGRNVAIGAASNILQIILNLGVGIVIARALGAEVLGRYALLLTANGILTIFGDFGISTSNMTFIGGGRLKAAEAHAAAVIFAFVGGGVWGLVYLAGRSFFVESVFRSIPSSAVSLAVLFLPFSLYGRYWQSIMVATSRIPVLASTTLAQTAGVGVVVASLAVLQRSLNELMLGWFAVGGLAIAVMFTIALRVHGFQPVSVSSLLRMVGFGSIAHVGTTAHQLLLRIDFFLVNALLGGRSLGYYSVATTVAEKTWIGVGAIYNAMAASVTSKDRGIAVLAVGKMARSILLSGFGAGLVLLVFGRWVVPLLYGAEYSVIAVPLLVLLLGTISLGAWYAISLFIIGQEGKPWVSTAIHLVGLGVGVPLYYFLIRADGIRGAAIASTVVYTLILMLGAGYFTRRTGVGWVHLFLVQRIDIMDSWLSVRRLIAGRRA